MMTRLKHEWNAFKRLEPGKRFQTQYRRHRESEAGKSVLHRILHIMAAVIAFAVGVVLTFIPGPAFVFFGLAAALLAMQSCAVARALDWSELRLRAAIKSIRQWWSAHRAAPHGQGP